MLSRVCHRIDAKKPNDSRDCNQSVERNDDGVKDKIAEMPRVFAHDFPDFDRERVFVLALLQELVDAVRVETLKVVGSVGDNRVIVKTRIQHQCCPTVSRVNQGVRIGCRHKEA